MTSQINEQLYMEFLSDADAQALKLTFTAWLEKTCEAQRDAAMYTQFEQLYGVGVSASEMNRD